MMEFGLIWSGNRDRWRWEPSRRVVDFIAHGHLRDIILPKRTMVTTGGMTFEVLRHGDRYIEVHPRGSRHAFYARRRHAKFARRRARRTRDVAA